MCKSRLCSTERLRRALASPAPAVQPGLINSPRRRTTPPQRETEEAVCVIQCLDSQNHHPYNSPSHPLPTHKPPSTHPSPSPSHPTPHPQAPKHPPLPIARSILPHPPPHGLWMDVKKHHRPTKPSSRPSKLNGFRACKPQWDARSFGCCQPFAAVTKQKKKTECKKVPEWLWLQPNETDRVLR